MLKEPERLIDLVEKKLAILVGKKKKHRENIQIEIDERDLPLNSPVGKS